LIDRLAAARLCSPKVICGPASVPSAEVTL
jgi:hypothetical protein